jgi:hypothetical protein
LIASQESTGEQTLYFSLLSASACAERVPAARRSPARGGGDALQLLHVTAFGEVGQRESVRMLTMSVNRDTVNQSDP